MNTLDDYLTATEQDRAALRGSLGWSSPCDRIARALAEDKPAEPRRGRHRGTVLPVEDEAARANHRFFSDWTPKHRADGPTRVGSGLVGIR